MKNRIKELIEEELKTCHVADGCSVNDIKLNSDLSIAIIENIVKNLTIPVVSNQRGLLIAFMEYYNKQNHTHILKIEIDEFIKLSNL